jgi:hypothetical protein
MGAKGSGSRMISGAPSASGDAPRGGTRRRCGAIVDESQQSGAPQPLRPPLHFRGLPLGRAPSLLTLLPVPPARDRRAASSAPRPRVQRAESPPGARPQCEEGSGPIPEVYPEGTLRIRTASVTKQKVRRRRRILLRARRPEPDAESPPCRRRTLERVPQGGSMAASGDIVQESVGSPSIRDTGFTKNTGNQRGGSHGTSCMGYRE